MTTINKKRSFIALFLVLCLGISEQLFSQQTQSYKGEYKIADYRGEASFNYSIIEGDTIFQGPFSLQKSNLEKLLKQEDFTFSFKGNFSEGSPDGNWEFRFGEFSSGSDSELVDFQYRISVNGIQEESSGIISMGRPHGQWTYSVDSIVKSEKAKNLFRSSFEFEEGVPQKSFRIESKGNTLVGRTLRNGLAHDQWSLFSSDGMGALENWYFENGILKKIELLTEEGSFSLDIYSGTSENTQTIDLNEGFLNVILIKSGYQSDQIQKGLFSLITTNAEYYAEINEILSELGPVQFTPSLKVIVELYPINEVEINYLDSIEKRIESAKTVCESILNNTHLNIEKLSDTETAFLYQVVDQFATEYVTPIGKLVEYHQLRLLNALPREELISALWPQGLPSREINISSGQEGGSRIYVGPDSDQYEFKAKDLFTIDQMTRYASSSLESIQQSLGNQLTIEKQQQELSQIEDELYKQSTRIEQLVDTLKQRTSGPTIDALEAIRQFTVDNLSRFSAIEDKEERLAFGVDLLECLKKMEPLAEGLGALPEQWEEIQQLYKDDIWNPHMAVIMQEEVKKRIKASYRKVLIPELLSGIKADLSCDNVGAYTALMESLYRRMIDMREEDTRKLERKLRRENDPREVLELFNVEPNYPN